MTGWFPKIALAIIGILTTACTTTDSALRNTQYQIVTAYVQAYNARDVGAMSGLMHSDIQWLSIEGAQVVVIADGKSSLVKQMNAYILSPAATTSEISDPVFNNQFVATRETARWKSSDGSVKEQSALTVYEIDSGLIRRIWYYPSR